MHHISAAMAIFNHNSVVDISRAESKVFRAGVPGYQLSLLFRRMPGLRASSTLGSWGDRYSNE